MKKLYFISYVWREFGSQNYHHTKITRMHPLKFNDQQNIMVIFWKELSKEDQQFVDKNRILDENGKLELINNKKENE